MHRQSSYRQCFVHSKIEGGNFSAWLTVKQPAPTAALRHHVHPESASQVRSLTNVQELLEGVGGAGGGGTGSLWHL